MLVSNIVNEVVRMNPDWTQAQVIGLINDIVVAATKRESVLSTYIDPTTGKLPYLSTTAGTFLYSISIPGVAIWKISEIVEDRDANWYGGSGNMGLWHHAHGADDRYVREIDFYTKKYMTLSCRKTQAIGSVAPTVTFTHDPGTNATKFQIMALLTPDILSAMSQSIDLSDNLKPNLVAAVQELIDAEDNGRFSDAWATIKSQWLPDMIYDRTKDHSRIHSRNYQY
jgi:hypothetical protein